jgi:hypothetical protein
LGATYEFLLPLHFVADIDPGAWRIVDKFNWIDKLLVFPRALLAQVKARP